MQHRMKFKLRATRRCTLLEALFWAVTLAVMASLVVHLYCFVFGTMRIEKRLAKRAELPKSEWPFKDLLQSGQLVPSERRFVVIGEQARVALLVSLVV